VATSEAHGRLREARHLFQLIVGWQAVVELIGGERKLPLRGDRPEMRRIMGPTLVKVATAGRAALTEVPLRVENLGAKHSERSIKGSG